MQFARKVGGKLRPNNYILANLPESEYCQLEPYLTPVDLPQGFLVAALDEPVRFIYFPTSGLVSTDAMSERGDSVEINMVGAEGLTGACALLGQRVSVHVSLMQSAGDGYRVPLEACEHLMRAGGRFTELVHQSVYLSILHLGQTALCNRLHGLQSRLARWLLNATDRTHTDQLRFTQEYLSQMLGARRSTVTVMAGRLQRAGLIEYKRGKITVLDRAGLQECACECYCQVRNAFEKVIGPGAVRSPELKPPSPQAKTPKCRAGAAPRAASKSASRPSSRSAK